MARTLERVKQELEEFRKALSAILQAQSYQIGLRNIARANLKTMDQRIKELEREETLLENGSSRIQVRLVMPRDI